MKDTAWSARHAILEGLVFALMACVIGVTWASGADSRSIEIVQARGTKPAAASASGVVREIDRANARIEIDHGQMPSIGMPAMTMTFKVKNPVLLAQVKPGDQVNFEIEQSGLGWIITNLNRKQNVSGMIPWFGGFERSFDRGTLQHT